MTVGKGAVHICSDFDGLFIGDGELIAGILFEVDRSFNLLTL